MIVDAFYYNGEVDLLQMRLSILDPYVDEFVVLEANKTFSGIPKSSYWERDKESWKPWQHKIRFMLLEDWGDDKMWKLAKDSPNTNGADHWKQEFYNKEKLKEALAHLSDDDTVFVSDCDEIWDPKSLETLPIWNPWSEKVYRIKQKVYVYQYDLRSNEEWAGTLLAKYKTIKNSILNHLRVWNHPRIGDGWHFTSMGGIEAVRKKLNDQYTEQSYNTEHTRRLLEERFGKADWLDRDFVYHVDSSEWPEYLKLKLNK